MCICVSHQLPGKLALYAKHFEEKDGKYFVKVQGNIDRTPKTTGENIFRWFQRMELVEKIGEIADESFHLFGAFLQAYAPILIYRTAHNIHHAAHEIEHLLHSFCFFGDVTVLLSGNYFIDENGDQLHSLLLLARITHTFSHFLAFLSFMEEHQLAPLGRLEKILKIRSLFSVIGYALTLIYIISKRNEEKIKKHLYSELGIHLGGFLFYAIPLTTSSSALKSLTALAGIIHAWASANRLMMQDQEKVKGELELPMDFFTNPVNLHVHTAKCK